MTSRYLEQAQNWCVALRVLMGYPIYAPRFPTTSWYSSSPRSASEAIEATRIASDMDRDLIHVAISLDAEEPLGVSLAVRQKAGVKWIPDVRLYAANEGAPVELLADDDRWFFGSLLRLTTSELPSKKRRAQGEEIAWRRWRQAVATMAPLTLEGSLWVPPGGNFENAIPHERLKVA